MNIYSCFGWLISSEISLDGLPVESGIPDIHIKFGDVPETVTDLQQKGVLFEIGSREFLLKVPDVATYHVMDGKEVTIKAYSMHEDEIRVFLLGSVMGYLLQFHQVLPYHASTVCREDKTLLFTGNSGAGKSTLATSMLVDGWKILTDDVTAIRYEDGQPIAYPGIRHIKLWQDSIKGLNLHHSERKIREGMEKYLYNPVGHWENKPHPVTHLFVLSFHNKETIVIDEIKGVDKFSILRSNTYRLRFARGTSYEARLFGDITQLASSVKVYKLLRPNKGFKFEEIRRAINEKLD